MTAAPRAAAPRRVLVLRGGAHGGIAEDRELVHVLHLAGHAVVDLDLGKHPDAVTPPLGERAASRTVSAPRLRALVERFRPHVCLLAGPPGLRPDAELAAVLDRVGAAVLPVLRAGDGEGPGVRPSAAHGDRAALAARLDRDLPVPEDPARPPRTVLVSGYYGAGNLGDELLLQVLLDRLRDDVPDALPAVAANDPGAVEAEHGVKAFLRGDLTLAEEYAARTSAILLGPGGHWHDYSIAKATGLAGTFRSARHSPAHMAQLPLMVAGYGGRVLVVGMGVGPLADPAARAAVNLTGLVSSHVGVRDEASRSLLAPMDDAWPAPVTVAPDLVYGLCLPVRPDDAGTTAEAGATGTGTAENGARLAVNLRPWTDDPAHRRLLAEAIVDSAAARGLGIVGVPMQPEDVTGLEELAAAAGDRVPVEVLPADSTVPERLASLASARALVSMRLHACLLMHRLRRPAVGLAYDPKVSAHFEQLGRGRFAVPLDVSADALQALVLTALDERLPDDVCERLSRLESEADAELDRIMALVAEAPRIVPDPDWVRHAPPPRRR